MGNIEHKPQAAVLVIWKTYLSLAVAVPALLTSLLFSVGGAIWLAGTGLWAAVFLFFYLFYFPVRYRRMSYRITEDAIILRSGVFYDNVTRMPIHNVQFAVALCSPFDRCFGIRTLVATAPGGRLVLPGLREADALALVAILTNTNSIDKK